LLAAAAAVAGTLTGRWQSQAEPVSPEPLAIDPQYLDLGTQYETPSFEHAFTLTNTTGRPIKVLRMASTCDCLRLLPEGEFTIGPGGAQQVRATVALRISSSCQRRRVGSEPNEIPIKVTFRGAGRNNTRPDLCSELSRSPGPPSDGGYPAARCAITSARASRATGER
jgi:hypothetical protein